MTHSHSGGCQCNHIRYQISGDGLALFICHCTDCQIQSGSAFGMSLIIEEGDFQLTSGKLKFHEAPTASGKIKTCAFCPDCGVRIYNTTGTRRSIKAGTLDDTSWLQPDAHYWTRDKQPWVRLPDELPCHIEQE